MNLASKIRPFALAAATMTTSACMVQPHVEYGGQNTAKAEKDNLGQRLAGATKIGLDATLFYNQGSVTSGTDMHGRPHTIVTIESEKLRPGENYVAQRSDLVIKGDVPEGTGVFVFDGRLTVQGNINSGAVLVGMVPEANQVSQYQCGEKPIDKITSSNTTSSMNPSGSAYYGGWGGYGGYRNNGGMSQSYNETVQRTYEPVYCKKETYLGILDNAPGSAVSVAGNIGAGVTVESNKGLQALGCIDPTLTFLKAHPDSDRSFVQGKLCAIDTIPSGASSGQATQKQEPIRPTATTRTPPSAPEPAPATR